MQNEHTSETQNPCFSFVSELNSMNRLHGAINICFGSSGSHWLNRCGCLQGSTPTFPRTKGRDEVRMICVSSAVVLSSYCTSFYLCHLPKNHRLLHLRHRPRAHRATNYRYRSIARARGRCGTQRHTGYYHHHHHHHHPAEPIRPWDHGNVV